MIRVRPSMLTSACIACALLVGCPLAVDDSYEFGGEDAGGVTTDAGPSAFEDAGSSMFDDAGSSGAGGGTQVTRWPLDGGPAASCSDGVRNNSETDTDCGGSQCPPCGDGRRCSRDTDCANSACEDRRCEK